MKRYKWKVLFVVLLEQTKLYLGIDCTLQHRERNFLVNLTYTDSMIIWICYGNKEQNLECAGILTRIIGILVSNLRRLRGKKYIFFTWMYHGLNRRLLWTWCTWDSRFPWTRRERRPSWPCCRQRWNSRTGQGNGWWTPGQTGAESVLKWIEKIAIILFFILWPTFL